MKKIALVLAMIVVMAFVLSDASAGCWQKHHFFKRGCKTCATKTTVKTTTTCPGGVCKPK